MKRILKASLMSSLVAVCMTGCATQTPQTFNLAKQKDDRPALIQVHAAKSNFHLMYVNDPSLEKAFNQYVKTGKAPNIATDGFIKYAYNTGQQPIVKVTPLQETVISLEPGERFTNISAGDPNRWSYSVAVSGQGVSSQQNVLVKPSPPDQSSIEMATNLVITTDKRIYNIKLVSSATGSPARNVSFWYPEEVVAAANNAILKTSDDALIASSPEVNLQNLNFNYQINSGGFFSKGPSWKPIRVFDDGVHSYIQFPANIANQDMPVLFIANGSTKELVNYRSKPPYFVVDKIFQHAVLVLGVGSNERHVDIINNHYA